MFGFGKRKPGDLKAGHMKGALERKLNFFKNRAAGKASPEGPPDLESGPAPRRGFMKKMRPQGGTNA